MLIVIEGPDKAGKTHLAQRFQEWLSQNGTAELLHFGPIQKHPLDEYVRPILDSKADHVICDRLHVGEQIYGPLWREGSRLSSAVELYIDMFLASRGGVLIWVDTPVSTIIERLQETPDALLKSHTEAYVVAGGYERHFAEREHVRSLLKPLRTLNFDADLMVPEIVVIAGVRSLLINARLNTPHPTYVGERMVDVLFAADRRSDTAKDRGLDLALAPYSWSSGLYFMEAVQDLAAVYSVGLVNATDDPDLADLVRCLGGPRVVALGFEAYGRCQDAGIEDLGWVPHPQWVKRFHHGAQRVYTKAIWQVAVKLQPSVSALEFNKLIHKAV